MLTYKVAGRLAMHSDLTESAPKGDNEAAMQYSGLRDFLSKGGGGLEAKGPVALVFAEDDVELGTPCAITSNWGFARWCAFMPDAIGLPADLVKTIHRVGYDTLREGAVQQAVNAVNRVTRHRGSGSITATMPNTCFIPSARPASLARCWPFTPKNGATRC